MSLFRSGSLTLSLAAVALAGCGSTHTTGDDAGPLDAGSIMIDLDGARFPDTPPEPDAARLPGNVGAACTSAGDCTGSADTCIPEQPGFLPGGYCTAVCDPADAASCPSGSTCIEVGMGQAFCFQECDPASTMRQCREGYGCASGIGLGANVCVGGCTDASDCDAGQECDPTGGDLGAGACFTPGATIGGTCTNDGECPSGGACQPEDGTGWPGGACLGGGCDPMTNEGCAMGDACLPTLFGGGGICADGCMTDADCRAEYTCREVNGFPGRLYCAPGCADDSECTVSGFVCNPGAGTCAVPFDPADLGAPCSFRTPCEGGTCFREFDSGYPGGYCAYAGCEVGTSGSCPGDGVCAPRGTRNVCLDACATDMDCRAGYACRPSNPDDAMSATACVPACTNDDQCPGRTTVCDTMTGFCVEG
jgi:hypothetical protein